jgi:hypothetical protein
VQRHAAKRKEKRRALAATRPAGARGVLRAAATWPLHECLITHGWQQHPDELVQILVSRRSPEGHLAGAVFLVDLACLGLKNAMATVFDGPLDYRMLRESIEETQRLEPADLDLVAKVIREGIAYARQFGFHPHRDYADAALFLAGADPDACPAEVPLGVDGKPFFVAGPFDDAARIMAQLNRVVGPEGYEYMVAVDEAGELLEPSDEEPGWEPVRPPATAESAWQDWRRGWRSRG